MIATDMASSITNKSAVDHFPGITWEEVKGLTGAVDMLIGFDNHNVFPVEKARKGSLALWSSVFGTGWMLAGRTAGNCACGDCRWLAQPTVNSAATSFKPPDFISAEALGTETPARCAACKS